MGRWPMVPLGKVLRHRKEFITIDDFTEYKRCRVQLHAKGIVLRDTVEGSRIKTKKQQVCRAGGFLVAEIDAKLGGYGIVPEELDGAIVSSHYFLYEIDEGKLNRRFLHYFIRTPQFREQVSAQGSTNYAAIRPHHVLEYEFPSPELKEQRQVVEKLELIAQKCSKANYLKSRIQEQLFLFVTSAHLEKSKSHCTLGKVLELHEDKEDILFDGEYPQVGIYGFGKGLFPKENVQGSETKYKHFNRLYQGALVLSQVKGWEGAIAVCPDSLVGYFASPEYRTFRCREGKLHPEYLSHLVATPWFWRQLNTLTRGVGARRERVRPELFLRLQVPMPSYEAQIKLIAVFNKAKDVIGRIEKDESTLKVLMRASLKNAFLNT